MPIIFWNVSSRFAENKALLRTDFHPYRGSVHILCQGIRSPENFFVELPNARSSAGLYREFHIGNTQRHVSKLWAWGMTAEFIAPWAGRQDIAIFCRTGKFRSGETLLDGGQPCLQSFEIRHNQPDVSW